MMIALYILASFVGYSSVAGVTRAVVENKLDREYWEDPEVGCSFSLMAWAWPFTWLCAALYFVGKPTAAAARYIALGGRTKPKGLLPEARVVERE